MQRHTRERSQAHTASRLSIAERIFDRLCAEQGSSSGAILRECTTLEAFEYLQSQLINGAESRKDFEETE